MIVDFISAEVVDLVAGGRDYLYTDSLYLGCFKSTLTDSAYHPLVTLNSTFSGVGSILECYRLAVNTKNAYYFALKGGNKCMIGFESAEYDASGISMSCNMACGVDLLNSGAICGGTL